MEFVEINEKLQNSINLLIANDIYLLDQNIHERTISHQLAIYLKELFREFNVDCEYDGDFESDDGKKFVYTLSQIAREKLHDDETEYQKLVRKHVIPDIIIHRRGNNANNLLIIEVKKSTNKQSINWDIEKIKRFTSNTFGNHYLYKFGALIIFTLSPKIKYRISWSENGIILDN